jgi:hypothetical protein
MDLKIEFSCDNFSAADSRVADAVIESAVR